MKCPHCLKSIHAEFKALGIGTDPDGDWIIRTCNCPSCRRLVCYLESTKIVGAGPAGRKIIEKKYLVRPKAIARSPLPNEVPEKHANDYKEACLVLPDSPKASAALSRRCLQDLLREVVKVKHVNLSDEIQQVIDSKTLPSHLSESIDAIRNIGNFAAHPIKSEKAGEIIDVELGEAEWSLDVLEALFDFYFVQPAKLKAKREALNKKLKEARKPKMK